MNLLAIETSSRTGSVALAVGDEVSEREISSPREQTARLLPIVDELLASAGLELADLDALVFGRGPGSFTGTRVAAGVVQGLAFASSRPIVAVSSLAALAEHGFEIANTDRSSQGPSMAPAGAEALCIVDARMNEVYSARFRQRDGRAIATSEEAIGPAADIAAPGQAYIALGDGLEAYAAELAELVAGAEFVAAGLEPRARDVLRLAATEVDAGRFVSIESALPAYLRGEDAWRRA